MDRIILHIDFNSFFASVEQQANPFLHGKPIGISGKGSLPAQQTHQATPSVEVDTLTFSRTIIATASAEAKRMGVKTAMSSLEAKRVCPEMLIIPGDPMKYAEITKKFLSILHTYSPLVEQFSSDEAFVDITHIAEDWMGAIFVAQMIRADIQTYIGPRCRASIGIANNKILAKLACESQKPYGLTVVRPEQAKAFVSSQSLAAICGIGPNTVKKLHTIGITTLQTLQETPLHILTKHFKSHATFLHLVSHGKGDDHVSTTQNQPKSISHSYTFPQNLFSESQIKQQLLALCDKVAWRMRKDGYVANKISVYVRYASMTGQGKQKQLHIPIHDGLSIYRQAWHLLTKIRDAEQPIRLLGVSASELQTSVIPPSLFHQERSTKNIYKALDKLQEKYGSHAWKRAATLHTTFRQRVSGWHYDHEMESSTVDA